MMSGHDPSASGRVSHAFRGMPVDGDCLKALDFATWRGTQYPLACHAERFRFAGDFGARTV